MTFREHVQTLSIGTGLGGFTGLAVGIWVHVDLVHQAIANIDNLSESQANAITVAIALIGVPAFTAVGAVVGIAATSIGSSVISCGSAIKKTITNSSFFNRNGSQTLDQDLTANDEFKYLPNDNLNYRLEPTSPLSMI